MKGRDVVTESDLSNLSHARRKPWKDVTESKQSNREAQEEKRTSRSKKGTTVMGKRPSDLAYNQGHACASGT